MFAQLVTSVDPGRCCRDLVISARGVDERVLPLSFLTSDHHAGGLHRFRSSTLVLKYLARLCLRSRLTLFLKQRKSSMLPLYNARWRFCINSLSVDVIQGGLGRVDLSWTDGYK